MGEFCFYSPELLRGLNEHTHDNTLSTAPDWPHFNSLLFPSMHHHLISQGMIFQSVSVNRLDLICKKPFLAVSPELSTELNTFDDDLMS